MARRNNKRKMNKIEPSEMTLTFATPVTPSGSINATNYYIDLSQVASLVNRRFYRQGINWAVSGMKFLVGNGFGSVNIQKLPNTWTMSNSWEKGMRTWMKSIKESTEETPSIRPKFLDFKIYADADHHTAGFGANLLPLNLQGTATPGEWEPSKVYIPDTTLVGNVRERELIATGASFPGNGASGFNAVSLIEGYAASRGLPNVRDPNAPGDASDVEGIAPENWMEAIFNDGTSQASDVINDLLDDNNIAPYPFENDGVNLDTMYPGGSNQLPGLAIHDLLTYTATTVGGKAYAKGGNFPCGLIKLRHEVSDESTAHNIIVQIDLVPGSHRGYLCEPMTEM